MHFLRLSSHARTKHDCQSGQAGVPGKSSSISWLAERIISIVALFVAGVEWFVALANPLFGAWPSAPDASLVRVLIWASVKTVTR